MSTKTREEYLQRNYQYHAPKGDQVQRYQKIREAQKALAETIFECCPDSEERKEALKYNETAGMWANKAIACNE